MARTNPTRLAQLQREFQKNEAAPVQKPGVSRPRGAGDDETYARRREELTESPSAKYKDKKRELSVAEHLVDKSLLSDGLEKVFR